MSFSRYAIEKKQVSQDRGVTWQDVTPSETRNGRLIGVARTLLECEDLACDLEKLGIELVDSSVPTSICTKPSGSYSYSIYDTYLPSGIAKSITFTAGIKCCVDTWGSSDNIIKDSYYQSSVTGKTATVTSGWNPTRTYNSYGLNGRDMLSGGFCGEATCYNITEFMPWINPNGTIKMAYKIHYKREHCSDEWEIDERYEPEFVSFGERWVKTYEDIYRATWQHQIAVDIICKDYGDIPCEIVWEDEGTPLNYYYDLNIPENVQPVESFRADGVAASCSGWTVDYQMTLKIDPDNWGNPSGVLGHKKYQYMNSSIDDPNCSWPWSVGEYQGRTTYYITPSCDYYTDVKPNEWVCVNLEEVSEGGKKANFAGFFCTVGVDVYKCGYGYCHDPYIEGSILDKTYVGVLIKSYTGEIYFPYKIPSNNGWVDDYLNASEYGFIDRQGNKIALEYVYGKYTNTSGVTQNFNGNASTTMSVPSDAVDIVFADSVTSIPRDTFKNNNTLSSITMNYVTEIGDSAFESASTLQTVIAPNVVTIGENAFRESGRSAASGLNNIVLNNIQTLGTRAFYNSSIKGVTLGSNLSSIDLACFDECSVLTTVNIQPTSGSVIEMWAFRNCTSLSSLTLSEGITTLGESSFQGCTSLNEVEIPSSVVSIGAAVFRNCSNLEYVTINSTATISVYMFGGCNLKILRVTTTTPPPIDNGRGSSSDVFTFASDGVIQVPSEAVDTYKNTIYWRDFADRIVAIP